MSQNDRGNQGRSEEDADDVRLMQLVGRGDTQAFEQLIEKHQTLVAGTVARMLGSSSDVEDIAQQVFIRVWKSARRYVPRAKFTTWLLKLHATSFLTRCAAPSVALTFRCNQSQARRIRL